MPQTATATVPRSLLSQKLLDDLKALPASSRLTPKELEAIYALAYAHVTQGQYDQALPVFSLLASYGPTQAHYLAGYALCLQMCERYEEAIVTYSLLNMLNPDSPGPALQVAECQLMLGRQEEAAREIDRVLRAIDESGGQYDTLRPRAQVMQKLAGQVPF